MINYFRRLKLIGKKLTTEEFIQRAKEVHGDTYNYSKVVYSSSHSKVVILCPIHGEFDQKPNGHLNGQGCKPCGYIKLSEMHSLSRDEFITRGNNIHRSKYSYEQVHLFKNTGSKVKITCSKHGSFTQTVDNHLYSEAGCPQCSKHGFNPSKPAILYYLRLDTFNKPLYKIGISNKKTVEQRYTKTDLSNITVVSITKYEVGRNALDAETMIKREYKDYLYKGESPFIDGTGVSEVFEFDVLGLDKE